MKAHHLTLAGVVATVAMLLTATPAQAARGLGSPVTETTVGCSPATLITAITAANSAGSGHLTLAANCTYTLTSAQTGTEDGLPPIRARLTIEGKGATITRSDDPNAPAFRIFEVLSGARLTLSNLTISNGWSAGPAPDGGGGIAVQPGAHLVARKIALRENAGAQGGGLTNSGSAEIMDSVVADNSGLIGAGMCNSGSSASLRLANTVLTGNRAASDAGVGGGVCNQLGGSATLVNTLVTGNIGDNSAGGIRNDHDSIMYLVNSHVTQNRAGPLFNAPTTVTGGGIQNMGRLVLLGTTVDHNHAAKTGPPTQAVAGGISNELSDEPGAAAPTLLLINSSVTANLADDGPGGIYNLQGTVTLTHSSVTANLPNNCTGSTPPVPGCIN